MQYITSSEKATRDLGKKLAKSLSGGQVFGLVGNLGTGKTCFIKGVAEGLNIKTTITSPTFVLMKVYPVKKHKTIKQLIHVDAYRLKNVKSWQSIGLEEYLQSKDSVVIIEWAEKIKKLLPIDAGFIGLEQLSTNKRRITISKYERARKSKKN
jgi:tRNA threonylcarbamoyladenosine biosynthesis protein TsaE